MVALSITSVLLDDLMPARGPEVAMVLGCGGRRLVILVTTT